jgi:O-antigen ligase
MKESVTMKKNMLTNIQNESSQKILLSFFQIKQYQSIQINIKYIILSMIFFLFILIIIFDCTFFASPFIACTTIIIFSALWLIAFYPCLAPLLVFLCSGVPSLQIHLQGHTIRPVELSLLICAILTFLSRPRIRLSVPHALALLFLAIAFVSFIHVPEISTNATIFGANKRLYNVFTILFAFFCGTFLIKHVANPSSFLVYILISNIPTYLIGLAQALGFPLPLFLSSNQNPALTGDRGRLVGPFDGAATFGIYLTGLFAVSLSCTLLGLCRRDRIIGIFMLFITTLSLIGSGTRSALIAIMITLFVGLTITKRFKLSLGFTALALGGLALFPGSILSHFIHSDTSTSNRLFLWKEAINIIIAHPVIGIGLEQFHYFYSRLIISPATQLNQHGISIHNQYLEWGVEGGILWLISGVTFLLSLIIFCGRNYSIASHKQRLPLFAALLTAIATMTTSFLDVPFDDVESGVFLCMLAGMAIGSIIYSRSLKTGIPDNNS